jgi:hypothetical protein
LQNKPSSKEQHKKKKEKQMESNDRDKRIAIAAVASAGVGSALLYWLFTKNRNNGKNPRVPLKRKIIKSFSSLFSPGFTDPNSPLARLLKVSADKTQCAADMAYGNPQRIASDKLVETFQKHIVPKHDKWFAYMNNHPAAQEAIAERLNEFQAKSPGPLKTQPG